MQHAHGAHAGALEAQLGGRRALLVVAAPAELAAVLRGLGQAGADGVRAWSAIAVGERVDVVLSGVGKANGAAATARCLDTSRHALVISLGIAGSFSRGGVHLPIGSVVVASASTFGDEGVKTAGEWLDCARLGFPPISAQEGMSVTTDESLRAALGAAARRGSAACGDGEAGETRVEVGTIATVSTCSGTNALAAEILGRTDALAEAMEGAAVGLVARRLGVPFGEVRTISNPTGDRDMKTWNIPRALAALERVAGCL